MKIGKHDIKNPLEIIECQIAFHSRDWSTHRRDRLIYAIVFGWDNEVYKNEFGWDDDFIKEVNMLHEKWEELKQIGENLKEGSADNE